MKHNKKSPRQKALGLFYLGGFLLFSKKEMLYNKKASKNSLT